MSKVDVFILLLGAGEGAIVAALLSQRARVRAELTAVKKMLGLSVSLYTNAADKYDGMVKADARYEELVRLYEKSRQDLNEHIRAPIHSK